MTTPLVIQIQDAALDNNSSVTDALRKAKLACTKLGLTEFGNWVDLELNGYMDKPDEELPQYRKLHGTPHAYSPAQGWQPIIFQSAKQIEDFGFAPIGMTISAIERSMRNAKADGVFHFPYPPEIQQKLMKALNWGASNIQIQLAYPQVANLLDAVRNILLEWTIEMEKQGILGNELSFTQQERAKSSEVTAQTVIYINQVGSFVQSAQYSVVQGGIDSTVNLTQDLRNALKTVTEAVRSDQELGDTQKKELLEQLAFLSEQSALAAKDRKPGLIRTTLGALTQAASTVSAMSGAWQTAEPILRSIFGP